MMHTQFLLTMLVLFFVIMIIEGVIILRKDDKKPTQDKKEISLKYYKDEKTLRPISSDKIKRVREKEEIARKEKVRKALDEGKIKVIYSQPKFKKKEGIQEAQDSEWEAYKLRKDANHSTKKDESKWWIE